jgi:hypothetical protein
MTRVLSFYLAFEIFIILVFCWALWLWLDWKPVGPNAFPGSPDAGWMYGNAYAGYHWANGLLEGVWLGHRIDCVGRQAARNGQTRRDRPFLKGVIHGMP